VRQLFFLIFLAVLSGGLVSSAESAEVKANLAGYAEGSGNGNSIEISGPIERGDYEKVVAALGDVEVQRGEPLYLDLNSKGGNFEEALKIAQFALDKLLSTKLKPGAECLSGCAVIFMSGVRLTTVGATITRRMHATAKLGFHAPTLEIGGDASTPEQMREAYDAAVEGIGSKLLALARFRGRRWHGPLIRSDLINEMMLRRGRNFFYIDTVRKALENDIELFGAEGPEIDAQSILDGCANFLALHTSSKNADETHYGDVTRKRSEEAKTTTYEVPLSRGMCSAHIGDFYDSMYGGAGTVMVTEINGAEGTGYAADTWTFWPGSKRLDTLPSRHHDEFAQQIPIRQSASLKALPSPAPVPVAPPALASVSHPPAPPPFIPGVSSSWNYPSRSAGDQGALRACNGPCKIAIWFRYTCAAIAIGERGGWGTALHANAGVAARSALTNCAKFDTNCALKTTVCSPSGYGAIAMQTQH
jgi:ATP-dependent protease ClpP protease subunit